MRERGEQTDETVTVKEDLNKEEQDDKGETGTDDDEKEKEEEKDKKKESCGLSWMSRALRWVTNLVTLSVLLLAIVHSSFHGSDGRGGQMILRSLMLFCSSLQSGAALYTSLVSHPTRIKCGPRNGVLLFSKTYQRTARLQAMLGMTASMASFFSYSIPGGDDLILIAGLCSLSGVAYTMLFVFQVDCQLLDPTLDDEEAQSLLLEKWGRLHALRTLLMLSSTSLTLWTIIRNDPSIKSLFLGS
jgi:hypothetical protein